MKHAAELYRLGTSKIKNQNVKKALESDVANYVVQEAQKKAVKNLFGWEKWAKKSVIFR